jgi:hypothetical protein
VTKKSIHQNRLARFPPELRRLADDLEQEVRKHPRLSKGIKTSSPQGAKRAAARKFNPLLLARDVTIDASAAPHDARNTFPRRDIFVRTPSDVRALASSREFNGDKSKLDLH